MDTEQLADLMGQNFPWIESEDYEWHNVHDGNAPKLDAISTMLLENLGTGDVFVHVLSDNDIYVQVAGAEAPGLIGRNVLGGRIHACNRDFRGFLVVMPNGVATAWKTGAHDV